VYVAGLLLREPRIAPWSIDTTPSRSDTEPSINELLPDPATPVTTTSTPSEMSTSTSCKLWVRAPRTSSAPVGVPTVSLRVARSSTWQPVAQLQQQVVHTLDVVRVQPDRRLIEHVGDVDERRAELADHLHARCAPPPDSVPDERSSDR
jgi:hypothetical protein